MIRTSIFALCFVLSAVSLSAVDLKKELSESAFRDSGLEKLTPEELATLNQAIAALLGEQEEEIRVVVKEEVRSEVEADVRREVEEELAIPKGDDRFGFETVKNRVKDLFQRDAPDIIESRIPGKFEGWSGNTRFRLENGQVWKQTAPDTFIVNVRDPKVRIRRGMLGSYLLKIEGYNSSVKVERIK